MRTTSKFLRAANHGLGREFLRRTRTFGLMFGAAILLSNPAFAQATGGSGLGGVTTVLQQIITFVIGPFGKALCTLAIMAVAIGWLMGRLEAEKALIVLVAMGVLMSAPAIASLFTGQ